MCYLFIVLLNFKFFKKISEFFLFYFTIKDHNLNLKNLNFDLRYTCIVSSINYIKNMLLELFKEKINLISIYILNNLKIFIITRKTKKKKKNLDRFPSFNFSTLVHKDQFTYFNSCTHNLNGLYLRKCT